jgi:hypothetical protein
LQTCLARKKGPHPRRASKGRTHGTAIWLGYAQSLDLTRIWPA